MSPNSQLSGDGFNINEIGHAMFLVVFRKPKPATTVLRKAARQPQRKAAPRPQRDVFTFCPTGIRGMDKLLLDVSWAFLDEEREWQAFINNLALP